jgi:hypothetical protein
MPDKNSNVNYGLFGECGKSNTIVILGTSPTCFVPCGVLLLNQKKVPGLIRTL